LGLAQGEFYDIRWSSTAIYELLENIRRRDPNVAAHKLDAIANCMREAFPEADVFYHDEEIAELITYDVRNRDVVAAAYFCAAHIIVTPKRDFPLHVCCDLGIAVWSPDRLACRCLQEDAELVFQILTEQAARLHGPRRSSAELLGALRPHVPRFAQRAGEHVGISPWVERPSAHYIEERRTTEDRDHDRARWRRELGF
jgi:hypothetical protein